MSSAPTVRDFECRYLCGTCGYEAIGLWSAHQQHYSDHQANTH